MMNDEIKKHALEILEKQCPDELEIYNRWERCIKMYAMGFRNVPQSLEEILDWYNVGTPYEQGFRRGELSVPLHFVNVAIHSGVCRPWADHYLHLICEPQLYVFVELLFLLNPYSEEQRLEMAKQDFMRRTSAEDPEYYMGYYGIDGATLSRWKSEAPEVPPAKREYYQADGGELRETATEILSRSYPNEQGAYHNIDEATDFYNKGCQAAIRTVALDWKLTHCTPEVMELFRMFNNFLQNDTSIEKIRKNFLPSVPEDVLPVFVLFLRCAEVIKEK